MTLSIMNAIVHAALRAVVRNNYKDNSIVPRKENSEINLEKNKSEMTRLWGAR